MECAQSTSNCFHEEKKPNVQSFPRFKIGIFTLSGLPTKLCPLEMSHKCSMFDIAIPFKACCVNYTGRNYIYDL